MQTAINKAITTTLTKPMSDAMATEFDLDQEQVQTFITDFLKKQLKANGKVKTPQDIGKPSKMNSFMYFGEYNRAAVKEELGSVSVAEVSKRLGEMWKDESNENKKWYEDHARGITLFRVENHEAALDELKSCGPFKKVHVNRRLSEMWQELSDEEQQEYIDRSAAEKVPAKKEKLTAYHWECWGMV